MSTKASGGAGDAKSTIEENNAANEQTSLLGNAMHKSDPTDGEETASEPDESTTNIDVGKPHSAVAMANDRADDAGHKAGDHAVAKAVETMDSTPAVQVDGAGPNTAGVFQEDEDFLSPKPAASLISSVAKKTYKRKRGLLSYEEDEVKKVTTQEAKRTKTMHRTSAGSEASPNVAMVNSSSATTQSPSSSPRTPTKNAKPKAQTRCNSTADNNEIGDSEEDECLTSQKTTTSKSRRTSSLTATEVVSVSPVSEGSKYSVAISSSSITECKGLMKFLKKHCKYQDRVDKQTDFLCVGKVSTTSKLLQAVVKGLPILTDDWLAKSAQAGRMLDPNDFLIRDAEFKKQYGRYLADAAGKPCSDVFADRLIYLTPAAKKGYGSGYEDIKSICGAAGARGVVSWPARELIKQGDDAIVIGSEQGDLDAITLNDHGYQLRTKDFLSHTVLRGNLRWDEAHTFTPGIAKPGKPGTKRRST